MESSIVANNVMITTPKAVMDARLPAKLSQVLLANHLLQFVLDQHPQVTVAMEKSRQVRNVTITTRKMEMDAQHLV